MVSSLGRVSVKGRTFYRAHNKTKEQAEYTYMPKVLKPWVGTRTGYPMVDLRYKGRHKKVAVHVLVLEAFAGPRPHGHVACHQDGSRDNNTLTNLRWDSYKGNEADKLKHGTHIRGERNHKNKLNEGAVLAIRASTEKQQVLADKYGVTQVCISRIKLRKSWAWLA